jgi:hypothetical protein
MADEEVKETVNTKLARIEENLKNLIDTNTTSHKEIITQIKDLCSHVNDENNKMNIRVKSLEDTRIENEASKKGELKAYKIATAGLTIGLTILSIIYYLKLMHIIP